MAKDLPSSIELTGNVYVSRFLAPRHPERKLPADVRCGDVVVYSHLDERGRQNLELRKGKRGKGPTRKTRYLTISGFFTALVFDGSDWRAFTIEKIVGGDGWYTSQKFKEMKIYGVFFHLEKLKGRTVVRTGSAYEVAEKPSTGAGEAARQAVAVTVSETRPAPPAESSEAGTLTATLVAAPGTAATTDSGTTDAGTTDSRTAQAGSGAKKRSGSLPDTNQLELF